MRRMDRRADAPEHLDGPLGDRAVLAGNLRDLRRVNRYLGGTALSRRAIDALVGDSRAPMTWTANPSRDGSR